MKQAKPIEQYGEGPEQRAPLTRNRTYRRVICKAATQGSKHTPVVVHKEHALAGGDRVVMDLDAVRTVFEFVIVADGLSGKLAFFVSARSPRRERTGPPMALEGFLFVWFVGRLLTAKAASRTP